MVTDIGEYLVGAYLQLVERCDVVSYNVRPPGGGLEGLHEFDVVGLRFDSSTAFICEVTTHIRGVLYGTNQKTVERIRSKHKRQRAFAKKHLKEFPNLHFQFWSPVVPVGYVTKNLSGLRTLELVINGEYKSRVLQLQEIAKRETHDTRNPVFRIMQILEHLRN